MSVYAESLKRLYKAGKLTAEQVKAQYDKGRITETEYKEILGI